MQDSNEYAIDPQPGKIVNGHRFQPPILQVFPGYSPENPTVVSFPYQLRFRTHASTIAEVLAIAIIIVYIPVLMLTILFALGGSIIAGFIALAPETLSLLILAVFWVYVLVCLILFLIHYFGVYRPLLEMRFATAATVSKILFIVALVFAVMGMVLFVGLIWWPIVVLHYFLWKRVEEAQQEFEAAQMGISAQPPLLQTQPTMTMSEWYQGG